LAVEVSVKKILGQWRYDAGKIVKAAITGFEARYHPSNVYRIKRIYCSDSATVTRWVGRSIGGYLPTEHTLKLMWRMPADFREPAVVVVIDEGGREAEATFVSDHFFDYVSHYVLQLKSGWTHEWEHGFAGALARARTAHQYKVTSLSGSVPYGAQAP
jgi:hypothetical protein